MSPRCFYQIEAVRPLLWKPDNSGRAGVSSHVWDVEEIVGLLDGEPERRKEA